LQAKKIIEPSYHEKAPPMIGNRSKMFAPQRIYQCKGHDNWVAITISNDHLWRNLIVAINQTDVGIREFPGFSIHFKNIP
jgi:crotonobetainyl-CoA:carnitine CoA-transferase CaiB-like acyl-CoA transferase